MRRPAVILRLAGSVALLASGSGVALGSSELLLRLRDRATTYRVLPVAVRAEFQPAPGLMPGVEGRSIYSTTADGIRGRPYAEQGALNLLAIGGSTTECLYLDDGEAWPALLESELQSTLGRAVWVGNIGVSGMGAAEHVLVVRHYAPQLRLDWVVVLVGVNDLMPVLRRGARYEPGSEDPDDYGYFLDRSFRVRPLLDSRIDRPFPQNLAVWNLAQRGYAAVRRWRDADLRDGDLRVEDRVGSNYERRRDILRATRQIIELPDLAPALGPFERNLLELVESVRHQGADLVLLTQPSAWHEHISPEMERLLWLGFFGDKEVPHARYRPTDLERALRAFNDVTLRVCEISAARCIDLASELTVPQRESYYYDDVHLNEAGARRVAEILALHLARWIAPGGVLADRSGLSGL